MIEVLEMCPHYAPMTLALVSFEPPNVGYGGVTQDEVLGAFTS